jgi:RHS repeat-associated protein
VGNRFASHFGDYAYNTGNQLVSDSNSDYEYDLNGNLIFKTADEGTTSYSYDYENRLVAVTMPDGTAAEYNYGPFGRRIEKKVSEDGSVETTRYFYDNEDILFEYDEYGNIGNVYVHGLGIDEPLAMTNSKGTYYYHADGLGSIVAMTDSSQKTVQDYEYDSFGNLHDQKNRVKQPYTFTGREHDRETGLYFYRARYYDAEAGRFLSEDPLLNAIVSSRFSFDVCAPLKTSSSSIEGLINNPQELNPFIYVKNNPVNSIDPFGLSDEKCCFGGYEGVWQMVDWKRIFNILCRCYWLCFPQEGVMWSGSSSNLESTIGTIINNTRKGGGVESGNDCLCDYPE